MKSKGILRFCKKSLELLFSFQCIGCGKRGGAGHWNMLCDDCRGKIKFIAPRDCCPGCGAEIDGVLSLCSKCMHAESRPWTRAYALFHLESYAQNLVHRFKYRDTPEIARMMGFLAAANLEANAQALPYNLITSVPLHWTRRFSRGFNQSELVAKVIGHELHIAFDIVLKRTKATRQQAALNRKERLKNLKNAFMLKKGRCIRDKNILLLDDVMTTGATLSIATEVLLSAGAARVDVMILGRR